MSSHRESLESMIARRRNLNIETIKVPDDTLDCFVESEDEHSFDEVPLSMNVGYVENFRHFTPFREMEHSNQSENTAFNHRYDSYRHQEMEYSKPSEKREFIHHYNRRRHQEMDYSKQSEKRAFSHHDNHKNRGMEPERRRDHVRSRNVSNRASAYVIAKSAKYGSRSIYSDMKSTRKSQEFFRMRRRHSPADTPRNKSAPTCCREVPCLKCYMKQKERSEPENCVFGHVNDRSWEERNPAPQPKRINCYCLDRETQYSIFQMQNNFKYTREYKSFILFEMPYIEEFRPLPVVTYKMNDRFKCFFKNILEQEQSFDTFMSSF